MNVTQCRVCESLELELVLDLGRTALANRFLSAEMTAQPEPTYPLKLVRCPSCGLLQIDETVQPDELFGHYLYLSQTSDAVRIHAQHLAETFIQRCPLTSDDRVVEVASNDGTVLREFQSRGVKVLGVEPAANIAEMARDAGVATRCEFFGDAAARAIRRDHGPAKLILARHVLAHVADTIGFVRGLEHLLADDGVVAVEFPHLLPFLNKLEYDQVYHEHLCYFSARVIRTLFLRCGLELVEIDETPLHGGSLIVSAQRIGGPRSIGDSVGRVISQEDAAGLDKGSTWQTFAARVARSRDLLLELLASHRTRGKTVAAYGAAAKGMTLLAYCGLTTREIPFIADRSPLKQNRFSPGHRIPVCDPGRILKDMPDYLLLLAWNFADEVAAQQSEYRRRGGRLIVPLPRPYEWIEPTA